MALADDKGNTIIVEATDNHAAEAIARAVCVELGCQISCADTVLRGEFSWPTGWSRRPSPSPRTSAPRVRTARAEHSDRSGGGRHDVPTAPLLTGKVVDVSRRTEGASHGAAPRSTGPAPTRTGVLELDFQNEHLLATRDGVTVATTPDLICVLDSETVSRSPRKGSATVCASPCSPPAAVTRALDVTGGLALAGPRYFGYETDYPPFRELTSPGRAAVPAVRATAWPCGSARRRSGTYVSGTSP
ncbi:hypothetical protein [Streptomyces sp. KL116D]|uniref:S-methyl thiohydantoin desulfurase domain-containing protein n=1 Tax=Streptomyces sp. KL116D TaxID=3045152 RepID=UPI0035592C08